jgi:hypothetical protein
MSLNLEWSFMLPMNLWHMKNQLKLPMRFVLNLSRTTAYYHLSKKTPFYFEKISCSAIVVELGYLSILLTEPI